MHDLETQRVAKEIRERGAGRVLIQLPDGLRPRALSLAEDLTRLTGAEILLSGDSCYGACDVAANQAKTVGADLIVHYGHSRMLEDSETPVIYVDAKMDFDAEALIAAALPLIEGWGKIGLASTAQHIYALGEVAEVLRRSGHQPVTGTSSAQALHDGQVLGCDYRTAQSIAEEVQGYLFIGSGRFHPIGLALATGKPVVTADPYTLTAGVIDEKEIRRLAMRRMAAITAAKGASRIGVLVSLKPGQLQLKAARSLRERLEHGGKSPVIICMDEIGETQLRNFTEAEAFISTACPRIALEGVANIKKPILSPTEAEVMLGEKRWEDAWGRNYFSLHQHETSIQT
jgi:2-(3-amino-3-carboxypropyl)histidine synthase